MNEVLIAIGISCLILLGYGFSSSSSPKAKNDLGTTLVPLSLKNRGLISPPAFSIPHSEKKDAVRIPFPLVAGDYIAFKEALGFKESRGRYSCVNTLGYMGKYQFGSATLAVLGIKDTLSFLHSPELQESVLEANIARNKWILRHEIASASGKTINGVPITESGLIAAAHLAGPGNVKKFIRSNGTNSMEDAFGTTVEDYLRYFAGFDLSSIKAKQKVRVNGEHYK
ncbi:hypothetical protein [Muriicola marianensis]|nr:hypothetical protein [Muriicola marianensis]